MLHKEESPLHCEMDSSAALSAPGSEEDHNELVDDQHNDERNDSL